ncbi:MAG: extradiol dioxygenase [Phycisphaerales bacterium]|nr:extradiol dioxygenase [Phycisphaerales bacterium]
MITGAHLLFSSTDPDADRAFLRDTLGFPSVDAGEGWLIFRLPPAEAAVHPSDTPFVQHHAGHNLIGAVLYLMCDDLAPTIAALEANGAQCSPVVEAPWGRATTFPLPSGASLGLYQPFHTLAIDLE